MFCPSSEFAWNGFSKQGMGRERPEMMQRWRRRGRGFPGVLQVLVTATDPFVGKLRHFPNFESRWVLIGFNGSVPETESFNESFPCRGKVLDAKLILLNIPRAALGSPNCPHTRQHSRGVPPLFPSAFWDDFGGSKYPKIINCVVCSQFFMFPARRGHTHHKIYKILIFWLNISV